MGKLRELIKACEICREKDPEEHYHLHEGTVKCTNCYDKHLGVDPEREEAPEAEGRIVRLHGCIELYVPKGMSAYEAWQELESHLEAMRGDDAGEKPGVRDYYLARYFDEDEEFGGGKTSHYKAWLREVSGKDNDE